jgi:hypothetical protein
LRSGAVCGGRGGVGWYSSTGAATSRPPRSMKTWRPPARVCCAFMWFGPTPKERMEKRRPTLRIGTPSGLAADSPCEFKIYCRGAPKLTGSLGSRVVICTSNSSLQGAPFLTRILTLDCIRYICWHLGVNPITLVGPSIPLWRRFTLRNLARSAPCQHHNPHHVASGRQVLYRL